MKKQIITALFSGIFLVLLSLALNSCEEKALAKESAMDSATLQHPQTLSETELIERGDYLVNVVGGCNDCHSPKSFNDAGMPYPDPDRLLSGHPEGLALPALGKKADGWVLFNMHNTAAAGPWGVSYAANISSDASGIGNWSEEQFFKAMREGKYKGMEGSRPLMPPMPWQNYAKMSDEDLRAIFLYLKSTRPVFNLVPAYRPPVK